MTTKKFTLIELLVVVAIIAILASLLLPALNQARNKGQSAACYGNIKQITQAFSVYANDYNGYPPSTDYPITAAGQMSYWMDWFARDYHLPKNSIYGYANLPVPAGSTSVFRCPGDQDFARANNYARSNYGINFIFIQNMPSGWTPGIRLKIDSLRRPSRTFWLGENRSHHECAPADETNTTNTSAPAFRHAQKANFSFFDGHVASKKALEIPCKEVYNGSPLRATWFTLGRPPSGSTDTFRDF